MCGQVADVALEVPLAAFFIRGLLKRHHARAPRVEVFHEALDRAAFAGGIAPFKHDDDARAGFFDPSLHLQQFDLQEVFLLLVIAAAHQIFIRVAPFAPVGRKFFIG